MLIVLASVHVAVSTSVDAQIPIGTGDRVRVSGVRGERLVQGTIESIGPTSIVVLGDSAVTVPTESLRSGDYRLARRSGTYGAEAALWTGVALSVLAARAGYCFNGFQGSCAENTNGAFQGAVVGLGAGAAVGAIIGSLISEYEDLDADAFGAGIQTTLEPRDTGDGWTVALGIRFSR
jgi:hypothetical protein